MELLDLMEQIRFEEAHAAERLAAFTSGSEDGRSVRSLRKNSPQYMRGLKEAASIYRGAFETRRGARLLSEALATSDFPLYFGDILDRQMLGYYQEAPYTWSNWCRRGTVPDFRTVKRFAIDGAESVLGVVEQQGEYPESKLVDTKYSYQVVKHGRRLNFAWETIVDDDLDALKDAPRRFGRASRRSEEKFATQLAFDANGPAAAFFNDTNKNKIDATNAGSGFTAVNPALSVAAVAQAMAVLANMKDTEGEPISIDAMELVYPPALEMTAQTIINSTQLLVGAFGQALTASDGPTGANPTYQILTDNFLKNRFRLNQNAYIPIVCSSANGNTSWMLVASPSVGRPPFEVGFLRGHEAPEIFIKEPNARRVGGGTADPLNGDFDNDSIMYKIRHVFGGTTMDFRTAVASNGSGS